MPLGSAFGIVVAVVLFRHAVQRAELVAVRIAQIGQIKTAKAGLAQAGRIFDGGAAMGDAGMVPSIGLFGAVHGKADCATIGMGGRLAIDRRGDQKAPTIMNVDQAAFIILNARVGTSRNTTRSPLIAAKPRACSNGTPDIGWCSAILRMARRENCAWTSPRSRD